MTLYRLVLSMFLLAGLALPGLAQEATETPEPAPELLSLTEALAIVMDYAPDAVIVEIYLDDSDADDLDDSDDAGDDIPLWEFAFADGSNLSVNALTGEVMTQDDDDLMPEATPDDDDNDNGDDDDDNGDDDNDNGDDDNDNSDDNPVTDTAFSAAEAASIAADIYPAADVISVELDDDDDDRLIWEVAFDNNRYVFVSATSGAILSFGASDDADDDDNNDGSSDDSDDSDDDNGSDDSDDDHDDDDDDDDDSSDDDDDDDDSNDDDDDDDDNDDD